jgi:SpoVK/Ycf46/Vps4 family AAA+-type ATPase
VFHSSIISGISLPHDKRLYYIPEVDTQLLEVAKKREKKVVEPVVLLNAGEKEKPPEPIPSLTLGDILNVLDGVPERNGHILILDTNRLDELDPALIRPGRIDRVIEWKKSSAACTRQMIEHFYQTEIPSTAKIPDRKWSAAELHSILHQSKTMKDALRNCCRS